MLIHLGNRAYLCDVTVADNLADSNLAKASDRPGQLARQKAKDKIAKYKDVAEQMSAVHLPFAVEAMGGLRRRRSSSFGRYIMPPARSARGVMQTPSAPI